MKMVSGLKPLFGTKELGPLPGYVRVERTEKFVWAFRQLYGVQSACLYNHSPIFPFSYLNRGKMKLFINEDWEKSGIIPVVQKNFELPTFFIHCPMSSTDNILNVVQALDKLSVHPCTITDVTAEFASQWVQTIPGWAKIKTSEDVVQDATKIREVKGRDFSSIRNGLKHVRTDLHPWWEPLSIKNKSDALQVFNEWKEVQGKKYFRVTIGRDLRLIEEYYDSVDLKDYFSFVYYVEDKPVAANFGCRSWYSPDWGIDVTVKANINYKGMGDFAFWHLISEMNQAGIKMVNDSGAASKNVKINKIKWKNPGFIQMFDLRRK